VTLAFTWKTIKGDLRQQTSLRNIRSGYLSWKQIREPASAVWVLGRQTLSAGHRNAARSIALYVARHYSDRTLRELAQLAGRMEYPALTMEIRRLERRLNVNKDLAKRMQRILILL
jgi:hypothetical protein